MRESRIKNDILKEICSGNTVSGGLLAAKLGVSRTAVWKSVNSLRAEGYFISGLGGGYMLSPQNTRLCGEQLKAALPGINLQFREETVSTNEDIKSIAEKGGEFSVIVARRQTGGKGRLGRSFVSPEGGLYFSILLRPDLPAETTLNITTAAAVAMRGAIEKVATKPAKIKWVNDIFIEDKKVCGILTEGVFDAETGSIKYAVLGVGVNVASPAGGFPPEISGKAGSLFESSRVPSLVYCALFKEFLKRFKEYYENIGDMPHIEEYRSHSYLDGKTITYKKGEKEHRAIVSGIGENGELIVKEKRKTVYLTSGEVEIKYEN